MEEIDTNLFGEEAGEAPGITAEVEKAKQEIDKTTALLKAAPDIPDAEEVGRSRAMAARVMKLAKDLVITDQASYETGVNLAKACTVAIQSVEKPEKGSRMAKVQEQKENAHSLHKFFTGLLSSLADPYKQRRLARAELVGPGFEQLANSGPHPDRGRVFEHDHLMGGDLRRKEGLQRLQLRGRRGRRRDGGPGEP